MFTMTGTYQGREVFIVWDDGKLEGDAEFLSALGKYAESREEIEVIGMGIISANAHLSKPLPASLLIAELMDSVVNTGGDFPQFPDVPDGSVI